MSCFEWYEDAMVFRVFIVIIFVQNQGKKEDLDENDFRRCNGNFFRKMHSESYLITTMFKFPSQQLRGQHFERYPLAVCFTDMD